MGSTEEHASSAAAALAVAESLRDEHPLWSLVPLTYSALHRLHGGLATRGPAGNDYFHPTLHGAIRDRRTGEIIRWGTNDVVVIEFRKVAGQYRLLFDASLLARYKHVTAGLDVDRFWGYHQAIVDHCAAEMQT